MMSFKTISLRKAIILAKLQGRATVACTQAFVEVISASGFQGPQQKHATLYVCTPVGKMAAREAETSSIILLRWKRRRQIKRRRK